MGGTVDVHAHVKIRAMHGEKVNSISGRLTVLHEVGVVRLQNGGQLIIKRQV